MNNSLLLMVSGLSSLVIMLVGRLSDKIDKFKSVYHCIVWLMIIW